MSRTLEGKKGVVTGGAQGLGRAICRRLAREGCDLILGDLQEKAGKETADRISKETGRKVLAFKVDTTVEDQVKAMFDKAREEFSRVDIAVSNAGILIAHPVDEFSVEEWRKVIDVNLVGYFLITKYAAPIMKAQGKGSIIQINSKSGKTGSAKNSAYAASKFGGIGHTQSLALELAEYGVRVNAVCPGNLLDSPLWRNSLFKQYARNQGITEEEVRAKYVNKVPMKRSCTYEDVCNVVVFLASDASSYVTGQAVNITGGQQLH